MKGIRFPVFLIVSLLLCVSSVFAQTQRDFWHTLERGKLMFSQGDYGNALLTFEDARRQRRIVYERMEQEFINFLSITEVRRIGDSLDWVERYIHERSHAGAAEALEALYYRIPKAHFNNSATAALAALGTLKDYPEAEYWIGEVYLVEGELQLALNQFQKAFALRQVMENPGFATELQYKIAAICRVRQEYNEMERILLSVLNADNLWSADEHREQIGDQSQTVTFARQAMTRTLENNGINRFLTLYRYSNPESSNAHRLLGFYYISSGRYSRAEEHLMFAFLIQNTVIIDEVIRRHFDFSFTTLDALVGEIDRNPLIAEYAEKNEYYKTAYYLGASLYGNGKTQTAKDLWSFLSTQNGAGEWQIRAQAQLTAPHVERALEMP